MINNNKKSNYTKKNLILGIVIGIWLFLFLFLVKPFKQGRLDNLSIFYIAISMAIVVMISYFIMLIVQNRMYSKHKKWHLKYEITAMSVFLLLSYIGTYTIYKSNIANGSYNIPTFFLRNYLPTVLILLPIIIVLRKYFVKNSKNHIKAVVQNEVQDNIIYIYGENKLDYLQIDKKDLISISSAQNYIEISFLLNNQLHKKLIRSSLKKVHASFPFLSKVHRSHLINPVHFISFKDQKNLILTMKEIPFSNKYKENLIVH